MARRRACYVPWFGDDWRGSSARLELSPAARHAYCELLWLQYSFGKRGIPERISTSDSRLALAIGYTLEEWLEVKTDVLNRFDRRADKSLVNRRMLKEIRYIDGKRAGGRGTTQSAAEGATQSATQSAAEGATEGATGGDIPSHPNPT